MKNETIRFRVSKQVKRQLQTIAKERERTVSYLMQQASLRVCEDYAKLAERGK